MNHRPGVCSLALVWMGLFLAANGVTAQESAPGKPFKRAIVFAGMGLDFSTYIGIYDAAVESGHQPDLIIATSGGSVAAAIISAFPDREDRLEHLQGESSFGYFSSVTVEQPRPGPFFARFARWYPRSLGIRPLTPDLESSHLLTVPEPPENNRLNIPFPAGDAGPRVVVVGASIDFEKSNRPVCGRKLFTETWFTDPETGRHLEGVGSPIARAFPGSLVSTGSSVVTDVPMVEASKASIAEPQLFAPPVVGGVRYTGGAVDLWPVELASMLADEVILPRTMRFDGKQDIISKSVFGYSQRDRQESLERFAVDHRVDMADNAEVLKDDSFWFTIRRVSREPANGAARFAPGEGGREYRIPRPRLIYTVPGTHDEFVETIQAQYWYGHERGMRAFGF